MNAVIYAHYSSHNQTEQSEERDRKNRKKYKRCGTRDRQPYQIDRARTAL